MRCSFFIFFLFLNFTAVFSQGVLFEPSVKLAFEKAKKTKRHVMIEVFSPDCGTCKALDSTLKIKDLGYYYNQFYSSAKINIDDTLRMKFITNKKILVNAIPLFLYFDQNENLIHFEEGDPNVNKMIEYGQRARLGLISNKTYLDKYKEGNKEISTLIAVGKHTKLTMDTLTNVKAMKDLFEVYPKDSLKSQESWSIVARCILDIRSGFANYWLQNLDLAEEQAKKDGQANMAKNILGNFVKARLYGPESKKFKVKDVDYLEECLISLGFSESLDDNLWQAYVHAYENEGYIDLAKNTLENIAEKNIKNERYLLYIAKFTIEETRTETFLEAAKLALYKAKQVIRKNDFRGLTEYNYLYAKLAIRENNPPVAKKYANEAVKNARLSKIALKPFLQLQSSIKL